MQLTDESAGHWSRGGERRDSPPERQARPVPIREQRFASEECDVCGEHEALAVASHS